MKLLWENTSLDSSFAQQNITLTDTTWYDLYIFVCVHDTTNKVEMAVPVVPKVASYGYGSFYFGACDWDSTALSAASRLCAIYREGNAAIIYDAYKGSTKDNTVCIPYKIYGIKF